MQAAIIDGGGEPEEAAVWDNSWATEGLNASKARTPPAQMSNPHESWAEGPGAQRTAQGEGD